MRTLSVAALPGVEISSKTNESLKDLLAKISVPVLLATIFHESPSQMYKSSVLVSKNVEPVGRVVGLVSHLHLLIYFQHNT